MEYRFACTSKDTFADLHTHTPTKKKNQKTTRPRYIFLQDISIYIIIE